MLLLKAFVFQNLTDLGQEKQHLDAKTSQKMFFFINAERIDAPTTSRSL